MGMSKEEFVRRYMADIKRKQRNKERLFYNYKYDVIKDSKAKYHKKFYR
ncbi:hypothetical protein ACSXAS_15575 (plasmid) [Clostridium perfringens]|jgi:hypothetical protein|nr:MULTISPECIES: hypothetical protein [Clostridium]MDM0789966.1 hypothetical protein [Clostridium perfringens]MDU4427639.1 hypothetical protein [Clostridium sp.]MDU7458752.1 hypothetical protein [Clostridium perfringens]